MAGDWIKMEVSTPEKAEVLAITAMMGWDDADLTVGKLFRMWRWFDQHTVDGNAECVSAALLDRIVGVSGFSVAVSKVGWLAINEHGIALPKFGRHNGKSAKARALTAKRVAKHKDNQSVRDSESDNAEGNTDSVSSALPREEKRREVKPPLPPKGDDGFDRFWSAYPKRVAKQDARKAWSHLKPSAELQKTILDDLRVRIDSPDWTKEGGQFIPQPGKYIRGKRWEDDHLARTYRNGSDMFRVRAAL